MNYNNYYSVHQISWCPSSRLHGPRLPRGTWIPSQSPWGTILISWCQRRVSTPFWYLEHRPLRICAFAKRDWLLWSSVSSIWVRNPYQSWSIASLHPQSFQRPLLNNECRESIGSLFHYKGQLWWSRHDQEDQEEDHEGSSSLFP